MITTTITTMTTTTTITTITMITTLIITATTTIMIKGVPSKNIGVVRCRFKLAQGFKILSYFSSNPPNQQAWSIKQI
jgi:hypothetical protein